MQWCKIVTPNSLLQKEEEEKNMICYSNLTKVHKREVEPKRRGLPLMPAEDRSQ